MSSFLYHLESAKSLFEPFFIPTIQTILKGFSPSRVSDAAIYSLQAGGKRIRPAIAINSYYANDNYPKPTNDTHLNNLLYLSAAIESIHTYSLIHDDLPSMDNDDMRRGMLTCHKKFDVPTAILAGDALNSLGFYLIRFLDSGDADLLKDCLNYLHEGAGIPGMITGQMEDLEEEGKSEISEYRKSMSGEERLLSIHGKKTGALIIASFLLGNRLRSDFREREVKIKEYAKEIGILFQITDDILDVEGSAESLGKTPGKDANSGKLTYPSLYGMETAKKMRDDSKDKAYSYAIKLESETNQFFKGLPNYIAERKN
ncbi:polyprenyl synthetase family protein [Leptospira ilyithenensis]|uniref:Polyprenyl synthetase family protein n=1 Tax=Leptospira ilyithenensis TaxID=2484901 RepID=A0A4R9LPV0_9LEPT|nr:polyprenyl synthetase family protein [Leptospira ilyithenensis]TGN11041.1 polyprenyl synthetase family protein [Leptospira ilyithenensis]